MTNVDPCIISQNLIRISSLLFFLSLSSFPLSFFFFFFIRVGSCTDAGGTGKRGRDAEMLQKATPAPREREREFYYREKLH